MQAGLRPPSREPGAPGAGRWERELAARLGTTALSVHRWEHGVSVPTPHFRQLAQRPLRHRRVRTRLAQPARGADARAWGDGAPALFDPSIPAPFTRLLRLVGRSDLWERLKDGLLLHGQHVLLALSGLPGVGKTALAAAIAADPEILAAFSPLCDRNGSDAAQSRRKNLPPF